MKPAANRQLNLCSWFKTQIALGKLRSGERIDVRNVCCTFGVSRTPVREALLQLEALGLVQIRPRRGAVVTPVSVHELLWMWEVLVGLEGLCAELAARRISVDEGQELSRIHTASEVHVRTGNVAAYDDANRRFHEGIYGACGNPYLADQVRHLRARVSQYRRYPFERPHGLDLSFRGHAAVVDAILSGADRAADAAMREHVMLGGKAFFDLFAELSSGALTLKRESASKPRSLAKGRRKGGKPREREPSQPLATAARKIDGERAALRKER